MSRAELESVQLQKLQTLLAAVLDTNPFYQAKLQGFSGADSLSAFIAAVPFTSKQEIVDDQSNHPPYGTNLSYPPARYTRFHQTSGTSGTPVRWLDTEESWNWMTGCWMRVYQAAGAAPEDRVFFPFSFGPFLGFWVAFDAAARLGCLAISGGGMRSAARLRAILENQVTVLCSTPSYAVHLAEVARAEHIDLQRSSVRTIIVAGEPGGCIPATRALIEALWPGARVVDHHGMTEIGPVSYECPQRRGVLHIIESEFLAEVIDPATGQPAAPGQRGELVLTNLGRLGSPLLRYRTGDIVQRAIDPVCVCGSLELALDGGILTRSDDMVIVRGVNLYPSAVEELLRSCQVSEFRVEIFSEAALSEMRIEIESDESPERVANVLQNALGFRVGVSCVPRGALPRFEGKANRWQRS